MSIETDAKIIAIPEKETIQDVEQNPKQKSQTISSKDNNSPSDGLRNLSACFALLHCLIFGLIIQASAHLNGSFIRDAGFCIFGAAGCTNIIGTLLKLEATVTLLLVDLLITGGSGIMFAFYLMTGTGEKAIKNPDVFVPEFHSTAYDRWVVLISFILFGSAIGFLMNVVPVYIALTATDKYRVFLLNSIGGLGVVGGLLIGNNFISLLGQKWIYVLLAPLSLFCGLFMILKAAKCRMPSKLEMTNFKEILKNGSNSTVIIILTMIANNFAGISYVVFNSEAIFSDAHSLLYFNITNIWAQVVTFGSYKLNNSLIGRKFSLILSSVICGVSNGLFYILDIKYHKFVCFLYIFGFNLGLGNVPFMLLGEIFPNHVIQEGSMIGNTANWVGGVLSMVIFDVKEKSGFIISGICCVVVIIYIGMFFKETKGQEKAEYQKFFSKRAHTQKEIEV